MIFQYFLCTVYRTINDNLTRGGTNLFLQFIRNNNFFALVIHKRSLNISEEYGCP